MQYARQWGYAYNWSIGYKSGWPYAAISRVWALSEAADSAEDKYDWFVHIDADALVWDPRCTFEDLIENRSAARNATLPVESLESAAFACSATAPTIGLDGHLGI